MGEVFCVFCATLLFGAMGYLLYGIVDTIPYYPFTVLGTYTYQRCPSKTLRKTHDK